MQQHKSPAQSVCGDEDFLPVFERPAAELLEAVVGSYEDYGGGLVAGEGCEARDCGGGVAEVGGEGHVVVVEARVGVGVLEEGAVDGCPDEFAVGVVIGAGGMGGGHWEREASDGWLEAWVDVVLRKRRAAWCTVLYAPCHAAKNGGDDAFVQAD